MPPWVLAALRQLERVEALVAELLDLARIRTGRLTLRPRPVDLAEVVRGASERLREVLARAGNALELDLPGALPLECDPARLEQVIGNLLSNAAHHAPGTRVRLRLERDGDRALLSVEDEGPGVPAEVRERVFEPYEKVDRAQRGHGLGLGLHIARQIVEAHHGTIRMLAAPGGGARVVVELPGAAAAGAGAGGRGRGAPSLTQRPPADTFRAPWGRVQMSAAKPPVCLGRRERGARRSSRRRPGRSRSPASSRSSSAGASRGSGSRTGPGASSTTAARTPWSCATR